MTRKQSAAKAKPEPVPEQPAKRKRAAKPVLAPPVKPLLAVHDVVKVKLAVLLADPGNPREISDTDFEALVASVGEFGLVEPFVARAEDKRIVGGHQRSKAVAEWLRRAGQTDQQIAEQEVTVVFVPGLSESKCRALNLALNRISGKFDYALMPDYLGGIETADMQLTGFLTDEVSDILHLAGMEERVSDLDPDQYLAEMNLKFAFMVATPEDAEQIRTVLTSYGMTGPKDASTAFLYAMRAAVK